MNGKLQLIEQWQREKVAKFRLSDEFRAYQHWDRYWYYSQSASSNQHWDRHWYWYSQPVDKLVTSTGTGTGTGTSSQSETSNQHWDRYWY